LPLPPPGGLSAGLVNEAAPPRCQFKKAPEEAQKALAPSRARRRTIRARGALAMRDSASEISAKRFYGAQRPSFARSAFLPGSLYLIFGHYSIIC